MRGQHHQQIERHVHAERDQPDPHRRAGVLAREIAGREHLDETEADEPPGVGHQAVLRHLDIARGETAVAEERRRHRSGQHQQTDGSGHHHQHHEPQRPIERA